MTKQELETAVKEVRNLRGANIRYANLTNARMPHNENPLFYLASVCGLAKLPNGNWLGYRVTNGDCTGKFTTKFIQVEGEYFEDIPEGTEGVCQNGIHVASARTAWEYFDVDTSCQFWAVEFKETDLLGCDGEKARIRGGIFTKISRPF